MKRFCVVALALLISSASYSQLNGCFQKKSRFYKSTIAFENEGTYTHRVVLTGDLTITSIEKGTYTLAGDSIVFSVALYGIDENDLRPQTGHLTRTAVVSGKTIVLLDKSGERHEKMRRVRCRQDKSTKTQV